MQRAGWCAQGNCLPILAVGRTEVSPGWRVTAARLPNPKLPCYKPPMTPPKLWELTFVPREAPKQYASLTCSSTQIILDKLLEFGGGGGGGGSQKYCLQSLLYYVSSSQIPVTNIPSVREGLSRSRPLLQMLWLFFMSWAIWFLSCPQRRW